MSKKTTKLLVIGDYRARMQNAAVSDDGRVAWIDNSVYQIQTEPEHKQAVLKHSRARHTDAAAIAAATAWVWQSRGITTKENRTVTLVQRVARCGIYRTERSKAVVRITSFDGKEYAIVADKVADHPYPVEGGEVHIGGLWATGDRG